MSLSLLTPHCTLCATTNLPFGQGIYYQLGCLIPYEVTLRPPLTPTYLHVVITIVHLSWLGCSWLLSAAPLTLSGCGWLNPGAVRRSLLGIDSRVVNNADGPNFRDEGDSLCLFSICFWGEVPFSAFFPFFLSVSSSLS